MAVKTEPNTLGDAIKWEEDANYSRRQVTIAAGNNLALLQVVGKITASGKYAAFNQDGTNGSENAAGILVAPVDATAADKQGVIIEREALVAMNNLVWPADIEAGEKAAAIAELEALGIKAVGIA